MSRRWVWVGLTVGLIVGGSLVFYIVRRSLSAPSLPHDVITQASKFTPYFYKSKIPGGFTPKTDKVVFSKEVLLIPMATEDGQTATITEQAAPVGYQQHMIDKNPNMTEIAVPYGKAWLTSAASYTYVSAVTHDKKTLLIINSASGVPRQELIDLVQALRPLK